MNPKQRWVFIALGLLMVAALWMWQKHPEWFREDNTEKKVPATNYEPRFIKEGELWLLSANRDTLKQVAIEIADKTDERTYGMMFRKHMDAHTGMFFIMPREQRQSFYMKNTYVSLDILYINSKLEIIDIVHRAEPLNLKSLPSKAPAKYVLELKGGYCKQNGIVEGMYVTYQRM